LIPLVNGVPNTDDVMYELASNPRKAAELVRNIRDGMEHISQHDILEISKQLEINKAGRNTSVPQEPLRQIKPSTAGGGDGRLSVSEARDLDYLRG
jgi:hypothetical protein